MSIFSTSELYRDTRIDYNYRMEEKENTRIQAALPVTSVDAGVGRRFLVAMAPLIERNPPAVKMMATVFVRVRIQIDVDSIAPLWFPDPCRR